MRFYSLYHKIIVGVVFVTSVLLNCNNVFASPCSLADGGVYTYDQNINFNSKSNFAGYETNDIPVSRAGSYSIGGLCDIKKSVYWTATAASGMIEQQNGWYAFSGKEGDYLQVSTQVYVYDAVHASKYYTVPFVDINNHCSDSRMCGLAASSGSKVILKFKIIKPFVGTEGVNADVAYLSGNNSAGEGDRKTMVIIHVNASVVVPQTCEINENQVVSMDFGDIGARQFSEAGAGNKPVGVNPQTRKIGIKCKNIDAQALLSLRIEANNTSGGAIVSDNKDLGFIVADGNKKPLTPNDINSKIPLRLDDNASSSVSISAWPVSITGNEPVAGKFTSEGYLRVDFD